MRLASTYVRFFWVPIEDKGYLAMDNTGGHGENEIIPKYIIYLLDKYEIVIIFQI